MGRDYSGFACSTLGCLADMSQECCPNAQPDLHGMGGLCLDHCGEDH